MTEAVPLPFTAGDDGQIMCVFSGPEIALLGELPGLALGAIEDDEAERHLSPDAAPDDPEVSAEFRALTGDDLRQLRKSAISRFEATIPIPDVEPAELVLTPEDADAWLTVIHDARYVLGLRIGVEEDSLLELEAIVERPELAAYAYLCELEMCLVRSLAADLEGWRS